MPPSADPFHIPGDVFCAGRRKAVLVMPAPHVHSQVELNFLLTGGMTYAMHGREIRLAAPDFVFFWGAGPHQTVAVEPRSTFVCIYVPMTMFLAMPLSATLSGAVLAGAVVAAEPRLSLDPAQLLRLRRELLEGDARTLELDQAELELMLRRVDLKGWRDLAGLVPSGRIDGGERAHERVCAMARYMVTHAAEPIGVEAVARAVGLHPNYAMSVFRRALGTTMGAFLTRQRLHVAQHHLATTRMDVVSIAFACGFGSVSRFYEAFGRQFGVSPHRFRLAARDRAAAVEQIDLAAIGPPI